VLRRVYQVLKDHPDTRAGRAYNAAMSALIVVNLAFVLIDTLHDRPEGLIDASRIVEVVSVIIFTIDYVLRIWTASARYAGLGPVKSRLRYVVSGMAIIDLLSILPFYLPAVLPIDLRVLRVLRLVRLIRVFKLGRHSSGLARVGRVLKKSASALVSSMSVVVLLMIVAAVLEFYVESPVQPENFDSAFSGLWWAVSTITTVGYGDMVPVTVLGKVLGAIIELLGVGLVAIPTGILSAGFVEETHAEKERLEAARVADASEDDLSLDAPDDDPDA